jgi:MFS family permease
VLKKTLQGAQRLRSPAAPADQRISMAQSVEDQNYRNLLINGAWFGPVDGGILNYLPVYLARLGASASVLSLLTSGAALMGILAYIPGGAYAERHRDLVKLSVQAGFLVRFSYLCIALLPFVFGPAAIPWAAVIIWSLSAIPNAVQTPAWTTVMQQAVSVKRRARLNGTRWSLYSLSSAIVLALWGYLLDHSPFPGGYQLVFAFSFASGLMALAYFSRVKVPPFVSNMAGSRAEDGLQGRLRAFFQPLTECRDFVRYNQATLLYRLIISMPAALYSIYWVNNLHATNTWIGLRGTVGYGTLVIGYRLWGHVANRMGHRTLLFVAGAGFALYPILTALAPTAQWLLPAAVVWGICASGLDIGFFDMLLACCPEGRQPSFSATANMLISIVTFGGPLLGAALAGAVGDMRTALFIIGVLQLIGIIFFMLLPSRAEEGLDMTRSL